MIDECLESSVVLDASVLADSEEDDAVDGALNGEVDVALGEFLVANGDVSRQLYTPVLDFGEKGVVHLGRPPLFRRRGDVFVVSALLDRLGGKYGTDFLPAVDVIGVFNVKRSRF